MKELTIGEVARYAGVHTSAIRYYESVGLLPPPKRVNGHRRYDPAVLKRLGLIYLIRKAGFGIRELQILFREVNTNTPDSASMQWRTLAAAKIAEMDALIKRTQATRAWLVEALQQECNGVGDCVTITLDESGGSMNITLTCEPLTPYKASDTRKARKLLTMPLPSDD